MKKKTEKIKKETEMNKNKLDQCTSASHPEMARNTDADEPCDDNRG